MNIGIITGSGFYDFNEIEDIREHVEQTPYGPAEIARGAMGNHVIHFIARHKKTISFCRI